MYQLYDRYINDFVWKYLNFVCFSIVFVAKLIFKIQLWFMTYSMFVEWFWLYYRLKL